MMKIKRPDPTTEEGRAEIAAILERLKPEAEEARRRSLIDVDDEPVGKLTIPNEIDLHRDRKENDD
ncbi:MAG TPA: hypothetical protein ENI64_08105 [Gammaproteobacteria bacterium]|nr:hypothetical protein [Gammaproteobacteria bacterium]